jgi:V/A-type H+-transporting ATPase subunit D
MDITPTRSIALELRDERRAMHEGYVVLDEKCLLLAGEMLRELARYTERQRAFATLWQQALVALQAALARHGIEGLQVYPSADVSGTEIRNATRSLMGVRLTDAEWVGTPAGAPPAVDYSPEAETCRRAWSRLIAEAVPLAAAAGNLERLQHEYRRAMRRARALSDVLLPELDRTLYEIETRLAEQDQEDAIWMRRVDARD